MTLGVSRVTTISLISSPDYLPLVRLIATCIAEGNGFTRDEASDAALALNEACTNAIRHGSPEGIQNRVTINIESDGGSFCAEVADCGGPASGTGISESGGLGMCIMRGLTDEVRFEQRTTGLAVTLTKRHRETDCSVET